MAAKTEAKDALSSVEHTALGMFAGVVEVTCTMPMVSIKNALQSNRSIPLSPRELYRGWLVNAIGIAPITGVSFGVNRLLQKTLAPGVEQSEMGLGLQMFCPTVAGVAAGLVCGPSELVMIQQQQRKQTLAAQAKQIYQQYGVLAFGRGLGPTFVREGLYSWGYLGLCPLVREQLANTPVLKDYPTSAYIAGGMASGVVACAATHPFDTVKTRMQANMDKKATPEYKSMPSTFMHVYREKGFFQGLYSGFLPRTGRLMVAVVILSGVKDKLVELVTDHRESAAKSTDM